MCNIWSNYNTYIAKDIIAKQCLYLDLRIQRLIYQKDHISKFYGIQYLWLIAFLISLLYYEKANLRPLLKIMLIMLILWYLRV